MNGRRWDRGAFPVQITLNRLLFKQPQVGWFLTYVRRVSVVMIVKKKYAFLRMSETNLLEEFKIRRFRVIWTGKRPIGGGDYRYT